MVLFGFVWFLFIGSVCIIIIIIWCCAVYILVHVCWYSALLWRIIIKLSKQLKNQVSHNTKYKYEMNTNNIRTNLNENDNFMRFNIDIDLMLVMMVMVALHNFIHSPLAQSKNDCDCSTYIPFVYHVWNILSDFSWLNSKFSNENSIAKIP